jgi:hypothetical protein
MTDEENLARQGQDAEEVVSEDNRSGLKVKTGVKAGDEEQGTWVATKP